MATIAAIRTALQTRLATITGLRVYERFPDTMMSPGAAILFEGHADGPYATFGGDAYDRFVVLLAVQSNSLDKAQSAMDNYMSNSGASSIQAAVEGDQTLGSVVEFALFDGWETPGDVEINDISYHGARANIKVWHR